MRIQQLLFLFVLLFGTAVAIEGVRFAQGEERHKVAAIEIHGGVNPASAEFIQQSIKQGEEDGVSCLVIRLDTPGGLLSSTRTIVQAIFEAKIPVVVYVSPGGAHAGSAGVMVTLAGHVAAMAPGTNIGAAHPVTGQGKDIEGDMAEKVTSDAAAFARSIAETRGRNTEWAVDAVRSSVSITPEEALKKGVIDIVAPTLERLFEMIDGRSVKLKETSVVLRTKGAELISYEMNWRQKLINTLSDPNIAYILLMIGAVGIYMELSHPGVLFPGIIGGISLILAFVSMQTLPINYGGLALLILGLALLLAEIFVPSFGLLGISGLISLGLGSVFLIEQPEMQVSLHLIVPTLVTVGLICLGIGYFVVKARTRKVFSGTESFIGKEGEVKEVLGNGRFRLFLHGEYWTAVSKDDLKTGDRVRVTALEGMLLHVVRK
ncbi:MAG: nodulation protein NfeD [Deltaproteobacteria bacterium]|nr:nodulation protein NfeD [Deltaproteobacteria bacterium]